MQDLDVAVLEVGLGGRLDAVNLVDADVAVVTSIGIDHVEYLGDTRELIAIEKAGIFRAGRKRPFVVTRILLTHCEQRLLPWVRGCSAEARILIFGRSRREVGHGMMLPVF
jgi:folylpolyglutamate synthase/dihydropteroate synthase